MKSVVLLALFGVSTAYAADDPQQRAIKIYCNDTQQILEKINGSIELSWIDQDENVWINFRDSKNLIVLTVIPKDNRKQACIVNFGKDIGDKRKYL